MSLFRALSLGFVAVFAAVTNASAQTALLLRAGQPAAVPVSHADDAATVLARVVGGPTAAERGRGFDTAIPTGTRLLDVERRGDRLHVTLGRRFLLVVRDAHRLDLAVEQLVKSAFAAEPSLVAVDLSIEGVDGAIRSLPEVLHAAGVGPDPAGRSIAPADDPGQPQFARNVPGALAGRRIVISPGHGFYWHSSLGWTTQRPTLDGLTEDVHTNEIAFRYLIPYLENMGAEVISCRERAEILTERIADNDNGFPIYSETGAWTTSGSQGFNGGTDRFATVSGTGGPTATWDVAVAADGAHPVYVWYRAGGNRASDATYEVEHSGGLTEVRIDQTRDDRTWVFLGEFWFTQADGARITLTTRSGDAGRVVIADAVKVGAGLGSIVRGGTRSNRARWLEASRYWAEYSGAPSSVWNSASSGQDNSDDVTCRPRFAEWRGADAFVSLHTNAGGGTGTDTFIYNGGATPGSSALQARLQSQIVGDIRAEYDPAWVDRGARQANFGEVRLLNSMPGVLIELAFHDRPGTRDHDALHDPRFRRIGGRAIARGTLRYFAPTAPFAPEPPTAFRVVQDGLRGLRLTWQPTPGANSYTIERSPDGKGFVEVARTGATTWSTGPLDAGTIASFRVRAWNATGRSFPTEVLTAGTSHENRPAELLLVQGFDRLERAVKLPDNTFDYLARHGGAIRDAGEFSLAFDAASNEAVRLGLVALGGYRAVDWACGEESTADDTFDPTEQALLRSYLQQGGGLLVSGAEIGWDLEARGTSSDRAFYATVLGARFVRDDAATYGFGPTAGGVFEGIANGTFDDGTQGSYDVDFPDVVAPADAFSRTCLDYANGTGGAAIQRDDGTARVVYLGFPLESVTSPGLRATLMARALRFLLGDRALDVPAATALGSTAPLSVHTPNWPNRTVVLAASFRTSPPIPLPGGGLLPLAYDGVFEASLAGNSPVFLGFIGPLDAQGRRVAGFRPPPAPILIGVPFFVSGFVLAQDSPPILGEVLPWFRIRAF